MALFLPYAYCEPQFIPFYSIPFYLIILFIYRRGQARSQIWSLRNSSKIIGTSSRLYGIRLIADTHCQRNAIEEVEYNASCWIMRIL